MLQLEVAYKGNEKDMVALLRAPLSGGSPGSIQRHHRHVLVGLSGVQCRGLSLRVMLVEHLYRPTTPPDWFDLSDDVDVDTRRNSRLGTLFIHCNTNMDSAGVPRQGRGR